MMRQAIVAAGVALRNVILGGNLVCLPLLRDPKKLVSYVNECLFQYSTLSDTRGIPQKNVSEALSSEGPHKISLATIDGESWFHSSASYAADIMALCTICSIVRPKVVFEIGTLRGYTAMHFALNTSEEAVIYTLDLPPDTGLKPTLSTTLIDQVHIDEHRLARPLSTVNLPETRKIKFLYGDSATFDFSPYSSGVDFFFIDGAHSYEYVRSDTLNALTCCKLGSVIAWHDFGRHGVNGVSRWLREFASGGHKVYSIPGGSLAYLVVGQT